MTSSFRAPGFAILLAAAFGALAATPKPTPTPTATPSPRLSGGFGKAPAGSASPAGEKKKVRITNESLTTEPDKGKVTTSSRPAPTQPPREAGASETAPSDASQNEEYWRGEARRLRDRVAELKEAIVHLQEESQKLENDFYAWDDGAYRDRVIKPAWDKAREDLVTVRRELPIAEKELADLPDRARKAGALPGWLRE
jgi:hypothetical protein